MREQLKHKKAFEDFYKLGGGATEGNAIAIAEKCHVHVRTFWRWYKELNWANRVVQRNIANQPKLEAKTDDFVTDIKADIRKDIELYKGILKKAIGQIVKRDQDGQQYIDIAIKSATDIKQLLAAFNDLSKLDLLLMGEATERDEMHFKMEIEGVDVDAFPDPKGE